MNFQDDLYDYAMEHNPKILDPALWSKEERDGLHKREARFLQELGTDVPAGTPTHTFVIRIENGKRIIE